MPNPMDSVKPKRFCPQCGTAADPAASACAWCASLRTRKRRPFLIGGGIAALLGVGVLLLPGAPGMSLLQQGGFGRRETDPVASPLTTAPAPAAPAPSHPVTGARPARRKRGTAVTSAPSEPEPLAPSMLLGAEATSPDAKAPSVVSAPAQAEVPPAPAAPSMVSAPAAPAPPPTASLVVTGESAPTPPSKGTLLENGWLERPGEQENPEIIINNHARRSAVLVVRGRGKTYQWLIGPKGLRETLLPGTYRYELREEIFEKTGRPDQVGSLACGQYKVYELTYWHRFGGYTHVEDIGDSAR